MKKNKKSSFLREKGVLKAQDAVKMVQKAGKAAQKFGELMRARREGFRSIEEKKVADYIRYRAEGDFYVPYDGYYSYERNPGHEFYLLVPVFHKYPEALYWLNAGYEYSKKHQNAYVRELCRRGVATEVEMALVEYYFSGCIGCENLLVALHKHGHKFSPDARKMMKARCPWAYQQIYQDDKC